MFGAFIQVLRLYPVLAALFQVWRHLFSFGCLYLVLEAFIQDWWHLFRFGGLYSGLAAFIQVWRPLFRFSGLHSGLAAFIQVWRIYSGLAHLFRFGGLLVQFHPNLLESLQPQLSSPRLAVRKRAIICLGYLVMSCDQILYIKVSAGTR